MWQCAVTCIIYQYNVLDVGLVAICNLKTLLIVMWIKVANISNKLPFVGDHALPLMELVGTHYIWWHQWDIIKCWTRVALLMYFTRPSLGSRLLRGESNVMMCSNGYNILKPSSNRSLFKLIISDQTLINCNEVLPIYVNLNGQTFRGVLNSFLLLQSFGGLNAK